MCEILIAWNTLLFFQDSPRCVSGKKKKNVVWMVITDRASFVKVIELHVFGALNSVFLVTPSVHSFYH